MSINFQFVLVPNQAVRLDTARLSHGGPNPVDRQIVGVGSPDDPLAVASVVAGTSGYSMQVKVDGPVTGPVTDAELRAAPVQTDDFGDFFTNVSRGLIPAHTAGNKAGRNVDIDAGSEDLISQGGIYTPPTVARIHALASTDAADTPAGVGARTVSINGLLADYTEANETVTLNGVTPVNTSNAYVFINRMRVESAGSSETNVGTISAVAAVDGTTSGVIDPGYGQMTLGVYVVPAGKTAFLYAWTAGMKGGTTADVNLMTKVFNGAWTKRGNIPLNLTGVSWADREYRFPLRLAEKTMVKMQATVPTNNTEISGTFDYLVIENP